MKIPILKDTESLCDQCVALCCRYYAFSIDEPKNKRDFEDIRWFMMHEDTIIFVEEGDWYVQVNRRCKALMPDNRCSIYENRPAICREYTTKCCDWHADEYDYDHLFTEPDQIQRFGKEYLAKKRKRRRTAAKKQAATGHGLQKGGRKKIARKKTSSVMRTTRAGTAKKTAASMRLRKTA